MECPALLEPVNAQIEAYAHARLRAFWSIASLQLQQQHRLTKQDCEAVLQHALARAMEAADAEQTSGFTPRSFVLTLCHDCRSSGCGASSCLLCQHNPSQPCTRNTKPKYLEGEVLRAACDAPLRVVVADKESGKCHAGGLPAGVSLEVHVMSADKYEQYSEPLTSAQLRECIFSEARDGRPPLERKGAGDQPRVLVQLEGGGASLADIVITSSNTAVLGGRGSFKLLVWAVDEQGQHVPSIGHAVSERFHVATRRVRASIKPQFPLVTDEVIKLENVGKATAEKLQKLAKALNDAGVAHELPPELHSVTTVGQCKKLIECLEGNRDLGNKIRGLLKLAPEAWEELRAHAASALEPDSQQRVWWCPNGRLGLVYECDKGAVKLMHPTGVVTPDAPSTMLELTEYCGWDELRKQLDAFKQQAQQTWRARGHPGWALLSDPPPPSATAPLQLEPRGSLPRSPMGQTPQPQASPLFGQRPQPVLVPASAVSSQPSPSPPSSYSGSLRGAASVPSFTSLSRATSGSQPLSPSCQPFIPSAPPSTMQQQQLWFGSYPAQQQYEAMAAQAPALTRRGSEPFAPGPATDSGARMPRVRYASASGVPLPHDNQYACAYNMPELNRGQAPGRRDLPQPQPAAKRALPHAAQPVAGDNAADSGTGPPPSLFTSIMGQLAPVFAKRQRVLRQDEEGSAELTPTPAPCGGVTPPAANIPLDGLSSSCTFQEANASLAGGMRPQAADSDTSLTRSLGSMNLTPLAALQLQPEAPEQVPEQKGAPLLGLQSCGVVPPMLAAMPKLQTHRWAHGHQQAQQQGEEERQPMMSPLPLPELCCMSLDLNVPLMSEMLPGPGAGAGAGAGASHPAGAGAGRAASPACGGAQGHSHAEDELISGILHADSWADASLDWLRVLV